MLNSTLIRINSSAPERYDSNVDSVIVEHLVYIHFMCPCGEIARKWMPLITFDDNSTLFQAITCRHMT